jgi:Kef-type K+ transport system membrane component KefB
LTIGFLLNTKGLVELVVLNVGLDIGVLTKEIFAAFVVMAIWCLPPSALELFFFNTRPQSLTNLCRHRNTILTTPIVWLLWTRTEKKRNPMMRKRFVIA